MPKKVTPFLMFEGRAEEAMDFYVSVIKDSWVESIERYGPQGPGPEGSVKLATMSLAGQEVMCIDSPDAARQLRLQPEVRVARGPLRGVVAVESGVKSVR